MDQQRRTSDRGDARVIAARAAMLRGDFDEVDSIVGESSGTEAEIRAHAVAAMPGIERALQRWLDERRDDPAVHLLLAIRRLDDLLWLAPQLEERRTPEQQHYDEVESLWRAVEHLQYASRCGGHDVAATAWMAAVIGALAWRGAAPVEDFEVCAKAAEEREPASLVTARWRIHIAKLDPDVDALAVATEAAADWPEGDPRHAEVGTAHIGNYHVILDEDKEAAASYWLRDDVAQSLLSVNERLGEPSGLGAHDASAIMAFVLPRTNQPRLALPHFERLDGRVLTWPFAMLREPLLAYDELFQRARARSFRNLLRRR